jgi:hypothetical protein
VLGIPEMIDDLVKSVPHGEAQFREAYTTAQGRATFDRVPHGLFKAATVMKITLRVAGRERNVTGISTRDRVCILPRRGTTDCETR